MKSVKSVLFDIRKDKCISMDTADTTTRPKGFQPHNTLGRGRPKGSRNAVQRVLDQIGLDNVEGVYQVVLGLALKGNLDAAKFLIDKVIPDAKGQRVNLTIPDMDTIEDVGKAQDVIFQGVAGGDISTDDGTKLYHLTELRRKTFEDKQIIDGLYELNRKLKNAGI